MPTLARTGQASCVIHHLARSRKLIHFKLLDVAEGLNYLHNCHMLHGDLKGVSPAVIEICSVQTSP